MQGGSFFSLLLVYHNQKHISMQKEKSLGSEPSPSSLRDATSPERGRFCSAYRQMAKSSPFGGAGERSEPERVTLASSPSQSMPVGLDSSPKGRALGSPRKLHLFAKASPFGRGGCERSEQTERARTLAASPKVFPPSAIILPAQPYAVRKRCRNSVRRPRGGTKTDCRFWAEKLCVLQILTQLSQKIRRSAIESTRPACIIEMLRPYCPAKREELLRRAARQRNGRRRWKNSVSKNHLRCWLQSSWC